MPPLIDEYTAYLLLSGQLTPAQVQYWLTPIGFEEGLVAGQSLQRLAVTETDQKWLAKSLPQLLMALADAANPDQILVYFSRLVQNSANPSELLQYFADNPRTMEILVTLFMSSQFLTEILLRYPEYVRRLTQYKRLAQPKPLPQLLTEIETLLAPFLAVDPLPFDHALDTLRRFQRQELLRIGMADLLDSFDLPIVTMQLAHLADSLVQSCWILVSQKTNISVTSLIIVALGKLGGEELNYSSDLDLLFLTTDPTPDYHRVGQLLIDALSRVTAEGFLYRVDLRLRPWGRTGALVSTLDNYHSYLQSQARVWEKQALLKARVIAGDKAAGHLFLQKIQTYLADIPLENLRAEIQAMKQRIEDQLQQQGRAWGEVKLGPGSIRDIEFVTQYLQLTHARHLTSLQHHNTLTALSRLFQAQVLTPTEYWVLSDGYVFLRTVEHYLQLMHYRQTHTLPRDPIALNHLAKRLGFQGRQVGQRFLTQYQHHVTVIRLVYEHYLAETPVTKQTVLLPHLTRMHATYLETFSSLDIEQHAALIAQLTPHQAIQVQAVLLQQGYWQVTIVGYDYLGLLSIICGLLFVHGFDIIEGHVFSYGEPFTPKTWVNHAKFDPQRKIVDVFTVRSGQAMTPEQWEKYQTDLMSLVQRLRVGELPQVQGKLAKQIALALPSIQPQNEILYPVQIEIDNQASRHHTVLRIEALDTVGFLYEFTNALALVGVNISRMTVHTVGQMVYDVLYVTNAYHQKITDSVKQHELRVATVLIKQFTHLLPSLPNPELALLQFRQFVGQLFTRPRWVEELTSLHEPRVLQTLARLLGVSHFLWQDFLRMQHANLFPILQNVAGLLVMKSKEELQAELSVALSATTRPESLAQILNAFKDREMFRIDMRQIQGYMTEFGQFGREMTDLAEVVLATAVKLALAELQPIYGQPEIPCPLVVLGLGKFGGRELGFASDIELMFVYEGAANTTGPKPITVAEYYTKLVYKLNDLIKSKREGVFELDFQLRPYGKAGSLAVALSSFCRYFAPDGEAWSYERQALVKLRPITGDEALGQRVMAWRDQFIYSGQPFDVASMRAMRERQMRQWVTPGTINAKLSWGGLVDIEYLVQGLQITYGANYPQVRSPSTRVALQALRSLGLVGEADYQHLSDAFVFLRKLINALRMVRGQNKDLTVPHRESDEFAFLARRLDYPPEHLGQLATDLTHHMTQVQEINRRLLGYETLAIA